jgi:small subunit ribosomal protein S1
VLSRRELIEQERNDKRSKLLGEMVPGDIRKGTVKNITDFGAFIDLNGIDGLLHITDMSWGRIGHPSEILKVGQDIDVVVLDINKEKERVSLGLKQKLANPWDNIETKYPSRREGQGQGRQPRALRRVCRTRTRRRRPRACHRTFLDQAHRQTERRAQADQEIEAVVLGINREEQKISLGIRQLETNPWDKAMEKYPPAPRSRARFATSPATARFIELEEGLDGMIHVSDISWTRKINHPSEVLKKGDEVEAVVLEVDKANQRIASASNSSAPIRGATIDQLYKVGDLVTGKVTKLASFGAFVGLQHEIDGLVHISQVSEERVDKIKNVLKVGQEVTARVIKIDKGDRRIGLSIKAAPTATNNSRPSSHAGRAQTRRRPRGVATRLRRRRRSASRCRK